MTHAIMDDAFYTDDYFTVTGLLVGGYFTEAKAKLEMHPVFLDAGARFPDVNTPSITPLIETFVCNRRLDLVHWCIAHGAQLAMHAGQAQPGQEGVTVYQSMGAGLAYFHALVEGFGPDVLDVKTNTFSGETPMVNAVRFGKADFVDYMVQIRPAILHEPLTQFSYIYKSPLDYCQALLAQNGEGTLAAYRSKHEALERVLLSLLARQAASRVVEDIHAASRHAPG